MSLIANVNFAIDIDGTLCVRDELPSNLSRELFRKIVRLGGIVTLCSGRKFDRAKAVLDFLDLDGYHVLCDGALVINSSGEILSRVQYSRTEVNKIREVALESGAALILGTEHRNICERIGPDTEYFESWGDAKPDVVKFHDLTARDISAIEIIYLVTATPNSGFKNVIDRLENLGFDCRTSVKGMATINQRGFSKGESLQKLRSDRAFDRRETLIAIGDGQNDIPLFLAADFSVAMGDASNEVTSSANFVTLPRLKFGLERALTFMLSMDSAEELELLVSNGEKLIS